MKQAYDTNKSLKLVQYHRDNIEKASIVIRKDPKPDSETLTQALGELQNSVYVVVNRNLHSFPHYISYI